MKVSPIGEGAAAARPLQRQTTSDSIADSLRQAILGGEFADGEALNQVALARQFGVSRVPIREALRQLQAEGLVAAKPHLRATVNGLTVDRVLEVLDIRLMLESYLLRRAAEHLTTEDFKNLDTLCAEMDATVDHDEWLNANRSFHTALYASSGAQFARDLLQQLQRRVERFLRMRRTEGVERNDEANAEHRRIVQALRRGDIDRARLELELHIAQTRDRVVEMFASVEEVQPPGPSARSGGA